MSDELNGNGPVYRVQRSRGMDPGTRRLAIIAGGLAGVLLMIVGLWSVSGHRGGAVPVIEADARPLRVKPDNPGGLQVSGANDEILSGDAGAQADKLLPPPEAPDRRALKAEAARSAMPAPASPSPQPQGSVPAAANLANPGASPAQPPAGGGSKVAAANAPARSPAVPGPAPGAAAADKPTQVQLAATETQQAAMTEWQRLSKRMPEVLGGRQPAVLRAERDGHTVWRLRTGGFNDIAQATAFCERVRSKGAGCSIASF